MKVLKQFGNFFGLSPLDLILNCQDISDVALLLEKVSPVNFDVSQCELECMYYQKLLHGLPIEYKEVAARKADAKRKNNMKLSLEEDNLLNSSKRGFIGHSIWTDGESSYEYITRNTEAIDLVQSLLDKSSILSDLYSATGLSHPTNISDAKALMIKLLKCTDKQLPFFLSQELYSVVSNYDVKERIKILSDEITTMIVSIGDNVALGSTSIDWEDVSDISLSQSEFQVWSKFRESIKYCGYDCLDGGSVANALVSLFKCAVLSDRMYTYDLSLELERCGFFFLRGNATISLLDTLKLVVFESAGDNLFSTKTSHNNLVKSWWIASMLLEEMYTEVGENL